MSCHEPPPASVAPVPVMLHAPEPVSPYPVVVHSPAKPSQPQPTSSPVAARAAAKQGSPAVNPEVWQNIKAGCKAELVTLD